MYVNVYMYIVYELVHKVLAEWSPCRGVGIREPVLTDVGLSGVEQPDTHRQQLRHTHHLSTGQRHLLQSGEPWTHVHTLTYMWLGT